MGGRDKIINFIQMDSLSTALQEEDSAIAPPFSESHQLCDELQYIPTELVLRSKVFGHSRLPGQPQIRLSDTDTLLRHCEQELCTPDFDKLAEGLSIRLCNEKQSTLSEQAVLERKIVVTENPKLHCVWDDGRFFVKPIPAYITSYAFWEFMMKISRQYACDRISSKFLSTASGFLRSYSRLITHPSDFEIARAHHLIPSGWSFEALILFLENFRHLPDSAVNPRYWIGEMQLQTLNASLFLSHGRLYHRVHRNRYNAFFVRYMSPTLFVFATFSVALSAMQVAVAVRQAEAPIEEHDGRPTAGYGGGLGGDWKHMGYAFRWFSLYAITFALVMGTLLLCFLFGLIVMDSVEQWRGRAKKVTTYQK